MIRSMTGFGRATFEVAGARFDVEVRATNHRYLDVRVRLPRALSVFESDARSRVQERFARGRVDVLVQQPPSGAPPPRVEIDYDAAAEYVQAAEALRRQHDLPGALEVAAVLGLPGVAHFVELKLPEEKLGDALLPAIHSAVSDTAAMREAEGAALEREFLARLKTLAGLADALEQRSSSVREAARDRLRKRAEQLAHETGLFDDARLHQEIVIAADRMDVTEEIVRLRSHLEQFRAALSEASPRQPVGRRLDFLLQEMGREANTVGSKSGDAPLAHLVVDLKTELERVREQVQNVE